MSIAKMQKTVSTKPVSRLAALAKHLDDGRILRFAFFAMLVGTIAVIGIDWYENQNRESAFPQYNPEIAPILPAVERPELDPDNPVFHPDSSVTTDPEILADPLELILSPNGILLLQGTILPGSATQLIEELALRGEYIKTIALNSPGGIVQEALQMGQVIREGGYETTITSGNLCASSCPLLLASGTKRQVEQGAVVGVHQIYDANPSASGSGLPSAQTKSSAQAMSDAQMITANIGRYLASMGIDSALWFHALETPPSKLYYLTHAEMEKFGLIFDPLISDVE